MYDKMNKLDDDGDDDDQQQQQHHNDKIATTTKTGVGTNTCLNENENNDIDVKNKNMSGLSNSHLLVLAFISFFTFTVVQLIFSFIANSHAMLGDSFAMLVDSITYLMNYGAEHYKTKIMNSNNESNNNNIGNDNDNNDEIVERCIKKQRQQRKRILQLEIIPPFISVLALSIITVLTTQQASATLVTELHKDNPDTTQPNVAIMFGFSFTNLLIDFINVSCFARSKHLMKTLKPVGDDEDVDAIDDVKQRNMNNNLNMCSAYTHISADTLRSITVVTTSLVANLDDTINKSIADAIAAIVVSVIILFTLIPLIRGLYCSVTELRSIYITEDNNNNNIIDNKNKIVIEKTQTQEQRIQENDNNDILYLVNP